MRSAHIDLIGGAVKGERNRLGSFDLTVVGKVTHDRHHRLLCHGASPSAGMFNRLTNNIPRLLRLAIQVMTIPSHCSCSCRQASEAACAIGVTLRNQALKGSSIGQNLLSDSDLPAVRHDVTYTLCWSVDGPSVASAGSAFDVLSRIPDASPSSSPRPRGPNCRRKNKASPNRNAAAMISGGVSASRSAIMPAPPVSLLGCLSWHCYS